MMLKGIITRATVSAKIRRVLSDMEMAFVNLASSRMEAGQGAKCSSIGWGEEVQLVRGSLERLLWCARFNLLAARYDVAVTRVRN